MTTFSINGPIQCNRTISFPPLSFSNITYNSCNVSLHRNVHAQGNFLCPFSHQSSVHRNLSCDRQRGLSLIAFDGNKNSEPVGEDDNQALDAVMKLYSAFKNKNTNELSEILADECRCVCNFLSFFQTFQGKAQVLEFFSSLISTLGDNVQIVVKPTLHEGMNVGVQWKFEWNKIHFPLGKGFSFHICQSYQGKAVIRNIEMFMEPLLYLKPFRLEMVASFTKIVEKIGSFMASESKNKAKRILYIVLAVLFLTALLLFIKLAS